MPAALSTGELVYSFAPVTPANTAESAPVTQLLTFPALEVVTLNWQVPPGPRGVLGWQLGDSSGDVIVPTHGGWLVTDGRIEDWALHDAIETGSWSFTAYNTSTLYDHTVYLQFLCQPLASSTAEATSTALYVVPNWPASATSVAGGAPAETVVPIQVRPPGE